jgi:hypothetical protein
LESRTASDADRSFQIGGEADEKFTRERIIAEVPGSEVPEALPAEKLGVSNPRETKALYRLGIRTQTMRVENYPTAARESKSAALAIFEQSIAAATRMIALAKRMTLLPTAT